MAIRPDFRKVLAMRNPCTILLTTVLLWHPAYSQNAFIPRSSFAMGSGVSAQGSNTVRNIAGEALIGSGESADTKIAAGFLAGVSSDSSQANSGSGFILYSRSATPEGTV